jgi:hypothetical protein
MFQPSSAAASTCVSRHGDQPIDSLFCIAGTSVKIIAYNFSSFAQRRDD